MNDTVKRYMGLAMLCAAHRAIPIGDSVDDADAKMELTWNGETLTFRMFDPETKYEYFSCKCSGTPTPADAEDIIRLAFRHTLIVPPEEEMAAFIREYER